jgi:hypothetical protein
MVLGALPMGVVRSAMAGIARHDLDGSAPQVCAERRDPNDFSVSLSGVLSPVQAMPGFDVPRTLAVIQLDMSRLSVSERTRSPGGATAEVAIEGVLVERFDPVKVEALFRADASETGQPVDQDLLDETVANVSNRPVEADIRETVAVSSRTTLGASALLRRCPDDDSRSRWRHPSARRETPRLASRAQGVTRAAARGRGPGRVASAGRQAQLPVRMAAHIRRMPGFCPYISTPAA